MHACVLLLIDFCCLLLLFFWNLMRALCICFGVSGCMCVFESDCKNRRGTSQRVFCMWCRLAWQRWWTSRVGLSQLQTRSAFVSDYSTRGTCLISVGIWKYACAVLHPVRCDWSTQTEIAPGCHSLELDYPSSGLTSVATNPSLLYHPPVSIHPFPPCPSEKTPLKYIAGFAHAL